MGTNGNGTNGHNGNGAIKPLIDSFMRQITYLRVSITDRCNFRCTYCMPEHGIDWMERDHLLRFDEIIRLLSVAATRGLQKIRITGGEPLVRQGVTDLVSGIHQIPGITDIALTTNGYFFKDCAEGLFKAGLKRVNISLDSLNKEKFARISRRDVWDRVWEAIETAEKVGFSPVKVNVVLMKGVNDDEAVDFARLTLTRPFHIRFIEYMPASGDWEDWTNKYMPVAVIKEQMRKEIGELVPVSSLRDKTGEISAGPSDNFRFDGAPGVVGFITAISNEFCASCNRIRLSADGRIRPCLFSEIGVDFREALRRGAADDELNALFDQVLEIKPKDHELNERPDEKQLKAMVHIGG